MCIKLSFDIIICLISDCALHMPPPLYTYSKYPTVWCQLICSSLYMTLSVTQVNDLFTWFAQKTSFITLKWWVFVIMHSILRKFLIMGCMSFHCVINDIILCRHNWKFFANVIPCLEATCVHVSHTVCYISNIESFRLRTFTIHTIYLLLDIRCHVHQLSEKKICTIVILW